MHSTGFLEIIIPEFERVHCLVRLDMYHRYTVDEHLLRSIDVSESLRLSLSQGKAGGHPPEIRQIASKPVPGERARHHTGGNPGRCNGLGEPGNQCNHKPIRGFLALGPKPKDTNPDRCSAYISPPDSRPTCSLYGQCRHSEKLGLRTDPKQPNRLFPVAGGRRGILCILMYSFGYYNHLCALAMPLWVSNTLIRVSLRPFFDVS